MKATELRDAGQTLPTPADADLHFVADVATGGTPSVASKVIRHDELRASMISGLAAADVAFTPAGGLSGDNVQSALQELDAEKAPYPSEVEEAGATRSVDGDDDGDTIYFTAAGGCAVTVDQATAGVKVKLVRDDGAVTIAAGSGVTLRAGAFWATPLTIVEQYAAVVVEWKSATVAYVHGELAT